MTMIRAAMVTSLQSATCSPLVHELANIIYVGNVNLVTKVASAGLCFTVHNDV